MRTFFSRFGKLIWRFMVIFSFIVNIILLLVLLALGLLIFDIKNNIADPLVGGLHGSFVGLDQATIDWTIPVRDTIPVVLTVPLETDTVVTLTNEVPLEASALINLNGSQVRTPVSLTLPVGLQLPVHLDLDVPIDEELDVALDVRAVIPLQQTQLHDVATNLRLLFEPLAVSLSNLPGDFAEAGAFASQIVSGTAPNLLQPTDAFDPWPGFSRTAGLNYELFGEAVPGPNRPVETGIVQRGGIPLLDEMTRPEVYDQGGPAAINEEATGEMNRRGILPVYFDGAMSALIADIQAEAAQASIQAQLEAPTGDDTVIGIVGTDEGANDNSIEDTSEPGG
jgi:hypothetical protein